MPERRDLSLEDLEREPDPSQRPAPAGSSGTDPAIGAIAQLQRTAGNAAVAQALARLREDKPQRVSNPGPQVRTYQLEARIAYGPSRRPRAAAPAGALSDAPRGEEQHVEPAEVEPFVTNPPMPAGATPATAGPGAQAPPEPAAAEAVPAAPAAAGPEAAPAAPQGEATKEEIRLPDIIVPGLAELEATDSVSSWMSYSGSITPRTGATPSGFGVTRFGDVKLTNVSVTHIGFLGVFIVRATVEHKITWQVRNSVGPGGEVSIDSFMDSDLTSANYAAAAADLTPDMSDLNGRPPRNAFWAQDLTERHENFHAEDAKSNGPAAVSAASAWLSSQTATDVPGVHALLATVPGRIVNSLVAAMAFPAVEERAYGDGAGAYSRRAFAIKTAGDLGLYP
ncbi:MAG TPA: hypothetical protein VFZ00_21790 [Solirubrobacter sp.]|nr:hypothetical protein [Solirubrobacter sp.]